MAGLASEARLPRPGEQLAAIARLRGRLFLNTFRRKGSGGKGELIGRIALFPFMAILAVGPIVGAGAGAFYIVTHGVTQYFSLLLWIVALVWLSFTISAQAAAPTFDLAMLIRFPLRFSTYLLIRLLFGLLDTPTVICSLALLSAAVGVGAARPSLFVPAVAILLLLDLTILFFFRIIFLWFDRFFAQRKTREVLIAFFFVLMLSFQAINLTMNGGSSKRHHDPVERARQAERVAMFKKYGHMIEPELRVLPPGLASTALVDMARGTAMRAAFPVLGLVAFGAAFLGLYAQRLRGEFRGENFGEAPASALVPDLPATSRESVAYPASRSSASKSLLNPVIAACLMKDIRYLKRSGPLLLALVTPVFMSFLIVTRTGISGYSSEYILPTALAYILLGLTVGMYNILGTEGPGVNLYFLAPIELRDIFIAKNILSVTIILIEVAITSVVVVTATAAPPLPMLVAIYLWLSFTVLLNMTVGNIRSIYSPRLVDLGKFRQGRQGQLNALIGLLILIVCLALGAGTAFLARHLGQPWLPAPAFAVFTLAAAVFYRLNLNHLAQIALDRREVIAAELCRT